MVRLRRRGWIVVIVLLLLIGISVLVLPNAESLHCQLLKSDAQFWELAQVHWAPGDAAVLVFAGGVFVVPVDVPEAIEFYDWDHPQAEIFVGGANIDPAANANTQFVLEQTIRRGTRFVSVRDTQTDAIITSFSDDFAEKTLFSWSPDGESVILPYRRNFVLGGMSEISESGLVLLHVDESEPRYYRDLNALPNAVMLYYQFTWSPDGQTLAFLRHPAGQSFADDVGAITLDSELMAIYTRGDIYTPLLWISNGAFLIYMSGGQMRLLDVKTGRVRDYIDGWQPALSSDGQYLAYLAGSHCQPRLMLAEANGDNTRQLTILERQNSAK